MRQRNLHDSVIACVYSVGVIDRYDYIIIMLLIMHNVNIPWDIETVPLSAVLCHNVWPELCGS